MTCPTIFERTIVYDDVRSDERLTGLDRASFAGLDAAGFMAASIRRGREAMIWAAGAGSTEPRRWTAAEVALFEDSVERTWAAIERARASSALKDREENLRLLVAELQHRVSPAPSSRAAIWTRSPVISAGGSTRWPGRRSC